MCSSPEGPDTPTLVEEEVMFTGQGINMGRLYSQTSEQLWDIGRTLHTAPFPLRV